MHRARIAQFAVITSTGACDPNDPAVCRTASRFSRVVLWCSAVLYMIEAFTVYLLGPILIRFDS